MAIDNPDERLRPGMTSQVSIVTQTAGRRAVGADPERRRARAGREEADEENADESLPKKKYVFVVAERQGQETEVTTGISDATHVAVAAESGRAIRSLPDHSASSRNSKTAIPLK